MMRPVLTMRTWLITCYKVISSSSLKLVSNQESVGISIHSAIQLKMLGFLLRWDLMLSILPELTSKILRKEWMNRVCNGCGDLSGSTLEKDLKFLHSCWLITITIPHRSSISSTKMPHRVHSLLILRVLNSMQTGNQPGLWITWPKRLSTWGLII